MPQLPAPQAARLRRPSWRDTRLVVGVLLIAIGVLLGARVVTAADKSVEVMAARHVLVPGRPVTGDDLRPVRVRLEDAGRYLTPATPLQEGTVVTRQVGEGELVPTGSVGAAESVALRAVAVPAEGEQLRWLKQGETVEVWVTPKDGDTRTPRKILDSSIVAAVPEESGGGLGPRGREGGVQVLVPPEKVADVVGAVGRQDVIVLVPLRQG